MRVDDRRCYGIYPENEKTWNLDVKPGLSVQLNVGWSDQIDGWAAIAILTSDHGHGGKVEEIKVEIQEQTDLELTSLWFYGGEPGQIHFELA